MRITDFVTPGIMSKAHIDAAERLIAPKEAILYAFIGNCKTAHGSSNRLIVLTRYRLLFIAGIEKPPQHDEFSLGSCIGVGDISGGLIKRQDYVCGEHRITVEATKEQLQSLTEKTLAAIEEYPNQPPIDFPAPPIIGAAPMSVESQPSHKPAARSSGTAAPRSKRVQAKERIAQNRASGTACCPKCGSTSLSANKRGFSLGKAAAGALVVGPVGLVGGTLGSNKLEVTCLNCGHKFRPGKK